MTELSALEHLEIAEQEALAWDEEASLVIAAGIEGPVEVVSEALEGGPGWMGLEAWERSNEDDRVGDGRAPVWLYRFVGGGDEGLDVVIGEGGEVVLVEEGPPATGERVERVNVDSPEVLEGAVESNVALQDALDARGVGVLFVLEEAPDRGRSLWTVLAAVGDGEGGVSVVDAGSGQVLSSHAGTGAYPRS